MKGRKRRLPPHFDIPRCFDIKCFDVKLKLVAKQAAHESSKPGRPRCFGGDFRGNVHLGLVDGATEEPIPYFKATRGV